MKLKDMRVLVSEGRLERDRLHDSLNALLADKGITVGERETREKQIRDQIRSINEQIFAPEVILGKVKKLSKGVELSSPENDLYQDCIKKVGGVEL